MLDIVLNEISLKFTRNDFQQEDGPDLLMNVWTYNYYKPHCETCSACKIYFNWCEEILEERWKEEWGNMKNLIEKILKNDVDFTNINLYSNQTKWAIIDKLIKKIRCKFF